jgi:type VI secretion system protein VasG
MREISRVALFGKLDALAYKAIEGATVFCKLRGNPYVELQHWLHQILNAPDSDLHRIVAHFGIDASALAGDLVAALDRLPRGASSVTDLSTWVENAVERGWVYASLMFGDTRVRTGTLVLGMLKTATLRQALLSISRQFDRIGLDDLAQNFARIVGHSPEQGREAGADAPEAAGPGEASGAIAPAAMGRRDALARFAVDLTERARKGEIDPVLGRDEEIRQIVDILMRRRQNNPILTGEAGVGKTAVVEGFALRLARGDVPPPLKDVALHVLDVGLLQAGASMKGEFESRLRAVIDEVQASPTPIILFIDEAHTLIGAGGMAGTGDAANLLKPALARGRLRTIAATTWAEYKKYIEKDPALTRRFQVVQVDEPDEERAILMLRGVASLLEAHHRVVLLDEAIEAAVRLAHRYIPARQLPDKAVSLLDTACARVAVSQHAAPPALEDCQRRLEALEIERDIICREQAIGLDTGDRQRRILTAIDETQSQLATLAQRHADEKAVVDRILAIRARLRAGDAPMPQAAAAQNGAQAAAREDAPRAAPDDAGRAALLAELGPLQARLRELQGDAPLILPTVDEQAVAGVVQDWTGVPVGRMVKNEIAAVLRLGETLNRRVVGQQHALDLIARRIQTSRARLDNPARPIGVFMLCGTSGVGKTETALALAEALYGGEQNVITINMSEFQEAHTVSTLKGAPPGYVGYGEGGVLTEAVRRRPYSVVLLDEVEKAHPDVHELFFQVFDKGWMEDGEGRGIDFKNTIILLTSNVGSDLLMHLCRDPARLPEPEAIARALRDPLLKVFPAALLGRLTVVPYYPLSDAVMSDIVRLQLGGIRRRIEQNHGVPLEYGEDVVRLVVSRCTEAESGGRVIEAILTNTVLPRISLEYLSRLSAGEALRRIRLQVRDGDFAYEFE